MFITGIYLHSQLDYAIKCLIEEDSPMTLDQFGHALRSARREKEISDGALDVLFDALDKSGDGVLNSRDDFEPGDGQKQGK